MNAEVQPVLFDDAAMPLGRELLLPEEVQQHRFTGEQVRQNKARYAAIVDALGEGIGVRQICRAFHVSQHTVEGIRDRDSALVATEKERTGRQFRRLLRMGLEQLGDSLERGLITPGQLPVCIGILADKSLLWDGQPTAVLAVKHELSQDALVAMFARMAGPVIDVETVQNAELVNPPDSTSRVSEANPLQIEANAGLCADYVQLPAATAPETAPTSTATIGEQADCPSTSTTTPPPPTSMANPTAAPDFADLGGGGPTFRFGAATLMDSLLENSASKTRSWMIPQNLTP